jgi:tRNA(Ile)-lysidine synthase
MLLPQIKKSIARHGLLKRGDKVLVACSGGADSSALLAALIELREDYGLRIAIAHFNHRLRRSANDDERFVIRMAQKLGLPVYVRRESIRAFAAKHGLNIEEAGRERRYKFLRETAGRVGAERIATAHTLTDQAETVLMRIIRGSGPTGLGGIAPCIDDLIIRPLIEVERREVEAYLRARKIAFREDETNRDLRFQRNRVRRRLIPYLEKNFEPKMVHHLGRLAEISREEEQVWEQYCLAEAERAVFRKKGRILLNALRLSALPPALGRRLVRAFLRAIRGDLRRFSFRHVEAVRCLAERKEATLPGKLVLRREKDLISVKEKTEPGLCYDYEWDGRKTLAIPEIRLSFAGKLIKKGKTRLPSYDDNRRAMLDVAKVRFPLLVRSRREGDRYRPLGSPGRKKLKEIMRAKGIPVGERDRRPVFLSRGNIVWVLGLPVAEDFKISPATKAIVVIAKDTSR